MIESEQLMNRDKAAKPKRNNSKGWAAHFAELFQSGKFNSPDELLPVIRKRFPNTKPHWVRDEWTLAKAKV